MCVLPAEANGGHAKHVETVQFVQATLSLNVIFNLKYTSIRVIFDEEGSAKSRPQ